MALIRTVAAALRTALAWLLPPLFGLAALVGVWALIAAGSSNLPSPGKTFASAVEVFAHPFYDQGPNDQGIGWNLLKSVGRVAEGFGLAALVGIPLGFLLGRYALLNRAVSPIISLLRPVSPLAWLPIGLAVFQKANPAAIFVIFICSIWPMIINTALGVSSVPQDYLNVARVLRLSEWKVLTRILLPASIPYVLSGAKLALGIAWLAIVASEMLTGGVGIGFWLWDEWNSLNMEHILIAILVIGVVGLLIEHGMTLIAKRYDYRQS
ncbi:MAG: ntrB [Hydrocarboniphaga sp.]|uniref:nitrate ABC transporter permease n=1 Tax=Hydrocarboniphaga sp. TaxID=2033016 RepID=UPI00280FF3D5|nr:ntrB [Hydrocarboniphaga sp.]